MNFTNNKNDIIFEFIDSCTNSGKHCGELLCADILSLTMNTDLDDDPCFPQFICDVSIEKYLKNEEYSLVVFEGGTYYISIICRETMYQK